MGDWRVGFAMVVMNGERDNRLAFLETLEETVISLSRTLDHSWSEWCADDDRRHSERLLKGDILCCYP